MAIINNNNNGFKDKLELSTDSFQMCNIKSTENGLKLGFRLDGWTDITRKCQNGPESCWKTQDLHVAPPILNAPENRCLEGGV